MKKLRIIPGLAVMCLAFFTGIPRPAAEGLPELTDKQPVRVRLVTDVDPAGLGEEFSVGVLFELAPEWHVYWTYPGNTGTPTRVKFASDERHTKVLEPGLPTPKVFDAEHIEDLSLGYDGSMLVVANAMVFDEPPDKTSEISAMVSWQACKKTCIKGKANLTLALKVGDQSKPSNWAERFKQTRANLPKPVTGEQAWLDSLTYEKGTVKARFVVAGFKTVGQVMPRWVSGGICKVTGYGTGRDKQGRTTLELTLAGSNCLPGAGGVVMARPADAADDAPLKPFAISAYSPPEKQPAIVAPAAQVPVPVEGEQESLALMLLFAFLGGLLLNIMPCVIPVVVPKILHVVRTAQKAESPAERRRLLWTNSLAYSAGVLATMGGLAVVVIILKVIGHEVGWGFQFQNPWFLVFMIILLVVAGLGMLKTFSLKSASHTDDLKQLRKYRRKSPLLESFFTGLLVTFLGTPCTAPMLGPALGYAFTAPNYQVMIFLLTVGVGLASPFLLLGAWTGWARILPSKVTEGYDRVMRFMAFLLFGTAVWLLSVMGDAYGTTAASNMLWFVLILSVAAWIFGLVTSDTDPLKKRLVRLAPLLAMVTLFGVWVLDFSEDKATIDWQPFSEESVAELRSSGKTVFIDFTAEWCMNCKANERLFIETGGTRELIDDLEIATVKADHTKFDPAIHKWLKRFGRAGVPMYIIFPACQDDSKVILLPEILTSSILHEGLKKAGASKSSCSE